MTTTQLNSEDLQTVRAYKLIEIKDGIEYYEDGFDVTAVRVTGTKTFEDEGETWEEEIGECWTVGSLYGI